MDYIQFISAAGIGGIIGGLLTAFVQSWLSNKQRLNDRSFQEKKEAYVGFLEAMHRSEIERSEESALHVGHWQARIELVGSESVIRGCIRITETNPNDTGVHPDRPQAIKELRDAMRKDLGLVI
jgi:hypothetical protein